MCEVVLTSYVENKPKKDKSKQKTKLQLSIVKSPKNFQVEPEVEKEPASPPNMRNSAGSTSKTPTATPPKSPRGSTPVLPISIGRSRFQSKLSSKDVGEENENKPDKNATSLFKKNMEDAAEESSEESRRVAFCESTLSISIPEPPRTIFPNFSLIFL